MALVKNTRFKSSELAGVDCGNYLKITTPMRVVPLVGIYTGDLEIGQCVAMVRVEKNDIIKRVRLSWQRGATTHLGVGDPYGCGRFVSVYTLNNSQVGPAGNVAGSDCGVMTKVGRTGDGCGAYYQFTCEADVLVTNLYGPSSAAQGGWAGGGSVSSDAGLAPAKWTGGALVLEVDVLRA